MTDTFRRRCESAPTYAVALVERAYSSVPAGVRFLLIATAAVSSLFSVSCEIPTDMGIINVAIADSRIIARSYQDSPAGGYQLHESGDGGLTWSPLDEHWPPEEAEWGRESVATPKGTYRIDGSEIVLESSDGSTKASYSVEHLAEPHNTWVQLQKTKHLNYREITLTPGPMVYDERSGNVVVAMGITGVLVGDRQGRWRPVSIWHYHSINFSPETRIAALLSASDFWTALLSFPASLTALALLFTATVRGVRIRAEGCLFLSVFALTVLSVLLSGSLLLTLGRDYSEYAGNFNLRPLAAFVSVTAAVIAVIAIALWQRRLTKDWLAIMLSLAGMILLVATPFIIWLQLGGSRDFTRIAAVILCTVVAFALVAYLTRTRSRDARESSTES